jgi:hypothetical protein
MLDWLAAVCVLLASVDPMTVLTAVIAAFTIGLFWVGWKTAKHQIRAYLTVDADSPHFGPEGLKLRIRNHGNSPASDVTIYTNIAQEIPPGFTYPDEQPPVLRGYLVAPRQHAAVNVRPLVPVEKKERYFLYGHIDYADIFGDRWSVLYCHEHQTGERGGWFPHPEHNRENAL